MIEESKIMATLIRRAAIVALVAVFPTPSAWAETPEIRIFGSNDEIIAEYQRSGYWGEIAKDSAISVPPYLTVATSPTWDKDSARLPVEVKKELFYRSLLPLFLYSNETILEDRTRLEKIAKAPQGAEREWLEGLATRYRLLEEGGTLPQGDALSALVAELATRVDAVPPSLALGQAAYESGYGTSRFAREGNALFGQWTYGGKGMQPKEKRASKGDYAVAAYDWPLDSVRDYMLNLNTHRAYQGLRDKRAAARSNGRMPTGAELADTLTSYSERGTEYVNNLRGIMRTNELAIADRATLEAAPAILIIDVPGEGEVAKMKTELATLRETGQLDKILADMGVDFD
jgi:Bax protein